MANTYVEYTQTTPTDNNTWTFSCWFKRASISTEISLYAANIDGSNQSKTRLMSDGTIQYMEYQGGSTVGKLATNRKIQDPAAWYHYVCVWDSDNGTPADRMKMYINGVRETSFSTDTNPSSGLATNINVSGRTMQVGRDYDGGYWKGCMSHVQFVDGLALAPTEFGEFDSTSGIWKIKTGSYATPGNNGFHLKMEDASNLDLDSSSNAHTFTTSGTLTATHDNPSNNFCTQNTAIQPLSNPWTFTNGATKQDQTASDWTSAYGTLGVTKGKWYYEAICGGTANLRYGWSSVENLAQAGASYGPNENPFNNPALPAYGIAQNGNIYYSSTAAANQSSSYGTDFDSSFASTYLGVYLDLDNGKLYYAYNGTIQASGVGHTLIEYLGYTFIPLLANYNADTSINYGNGTFGSTALTGTTYSDDAGIGTFKYSPNDSGGSSFDSSAKNFYALCTKNISTYG